MVFDKVTEKPRGYAFVEFEDEADMHGKFSLSTHQSLDPRPDGAPVLPVHVVLVSEFVSILGKRC